MKARHAFLVGAIAALTGCATTNDESNLGSGDARFHEVLLPDAQRTYAGLIPSHPDIAVINEMNVAAPLLLIGVEKRDRRDVRKHLWGDCAPDARCLRTSRMPNLTARIEMEFEQFFRGEPTYVSHIVQFGSTGPSCVFYSSYPFPGTCATAFGAPPGLNLYDAGWEAILATTATLESMVAAENATHVILISTGWNTPQWESIYDYRLWARELRAAAQRIGQPFRPVYVGFSWKSQGVTDLSYIKDVGVRSNDASEVGYVWGGLTLHRVVVPVAKAKGVKVIAIGHSFGAKLVTSAVHSAPLHAVQEPRSVDLLIGLQPAFSVNRFVKETPFGAWEFREFRTTAGKVAITSSRFDSANGFVPNFRFLGGEPGYELSRDSEYLQVFEHGSLVADGTLKSHIACTNGKILMVEASQVVKDGSTFSGAHSDVYDAEMAHFMIQLIRACAS